MKVVLQQKMSGLYLKGAGTWTPNTTDAMDFMSSSRVTEFCAAHKISGVQIVLKFEEQHYDIVLPMAAAERRHHALRTAHAV